MPKIAFTFDTGNLPESTVETVRAEVELNTEHHESFTRLVEIANLKKLKFVEVFIPGVRWLGENLGLETTDFVLSNIHGVALRATHPRASRIEVCSRWMSWEQIDELAQPESCAA